MSKVVLPMLFLLLVLAANAVADLQGDIDAVRERIGFIQGQIQADQEAIAALDGMISDCTSNQDSCGQDQLDSLMTQRGDNEADLYNWQEELGAAETELNDLMAQQSQQQ